MKVLFAYPNSTHAVQVPLGIAYLSAVLKTVDFKTGLLDLTWDRRESSIIRRMKGYDVLAISSGTLERSIALKIARLWKERYDKPVVIGGYDATVCPEELIKEPDIDAVCCGEGEQAFFRFMSMYGVHEELPTSVGNLWVKKDGEVYRNPVEFLIQDLDLLPFPDRSIFDKRHIENPYPTCTFMLSRGCPYRCASCVNRYLQSLYRGLGKYTRFRSAENVIEEIKEVKSKYKIKGLYFVDDTFTVNHKLVKRLCKLLKEEIDLPFVIMGRCNTVNRELLRKLQRAGCVQIAYGVESGHEGIRNNVLERGMKTEDIVNAFDMTNELGMRAVSFNMIGIPFENRKRIWETIKLNRRLKPSTTQVTLLYPFPKTRILEIAEFHGMLANHDSPTDYYSDTVIKLPTISRAELVALQRVMPFYVYLPRFTHPIIRLFEFLLSKFKLKSVLRVITFGFRKLIPAWRR